MSIVIYHNPECGTSRNVLMIIEAADYKPTVIEYLKTGWTKPQLLPLINARRLSTLIRRVISLRTVEGDTLLRRASLNAAKSAGTSSEVVLSAIADLSGRR